MRSGRRAAIAIGTGAARLTLTTLLCLASLAPAWAAERQDCVRAEIVLWGDGKHDDTAALAAWLRGADALWAESGKPVGSVIAGRSFRLSNAVYVEAGTGRRLERFRLVWPERGEIVTGDAILTGSASDKAPVMSGVRVEGGDAGEGVPFEIPDPPQGQEHDRASCAIS